MDNKEKLLTISELSKKLNFIDPITKKPINHILRYWEKEFKQIKPIKINNRRYYSIKQVEMIRRVKNMISFSVSLSSFKGFRISNAVSMWFTAAPCAYMLFDNSYIRILIFMISFEFSP